MGQQCCAGDQGKATTDGLAPMQTTAKRKLESQTRAAESDALYAKASFSTDTSRERSDTYAELDPSHRRSSSFVKKMNLQIAIPENQTNDQNPNFKTPQQYDIQKNALEEIDDAESDFMVMAPSDSVSSMGSQMVRMDSQQALSQASSFQNIHEMNKDQSMGKMISAGSATQFTSVQERTNESDDEESVIQRVEMGEDSDDESQMQRVEDDAMSDATSVMQRVDVDDGTSSKSSVMQLVKDSGSSSTQSFNANPNSYNVPKELRGLGRDNGSVADLTGGQMSRAALGSGVRSTANLNTAGHINNL